MAKITSVATYKIAEEIRQPKLTKKDLRAAIRVLENMRDLLKRGWIQGHMKVVREHALDPVWRADQGWREKHRATKEAKHLYCLVGALHEVDGQAEGIARRVLTVCLPPERQNYAFGLTKSGEESDLIDFNDDDDATQGKVLKLVDKAIRKIRKEVA